MKYFVVTVRKKLGDNRCYYPIGYDDINSVTVMDKYFEEDGVFKRLHVIPDEKAINIIRNDVEEVDEIEVERISQIDEVEEVINDEAKIKRIELKVRVLELKNAMGEKINDSEKITDDEMKALDPNDSTSGIIKKEKFFDKIKTFKNKELNNEFKKEKYA